MGADREEVLGSSEGMKVLARREAARLKCSGIRCLPTGKSNPAENFLKGYGKITCSEGHVPS